MAKTLSPVVKAYLVIYNVVLTLGWAFVGYRGLNALFSDGVNGALTTGHAKIWAATEIPLKIFQSAAIMEVGHAILGFTPTSFIIVGFQVASRLGVVWGCLDLAPPATESIGVLFLFICWTVTEVIRYSYYALHLIGMASIIQWLRYSLFYILYPLGVTGELMAIYASLDYIKKHNVWTIRMPNAYNVTFNYHHMLMCAMLMYIPVFPQLFGHMRVQRRKVLGKAKEN